METNHTLVSRRAFLRTAAMAAAATPLLTHPAAAAAASRKGMIVLTVNLEMSRNFPRLMDTQWDFEKGNLDADNKRYAVELGRFLKARGATAAYFVVGQVLEQENVDWLKELHRDGHILGNHTYDHVNLVGAKPEDLQHRFRRSPWLVEGRTAEQVVEDNIRMTNSAMRHRLGLERIRGFRSSNEYLNGMDDKPAVQAMLKRLGFDWAGTKFSDVRVRPLERASEKLFEAVVASQPTTQPYLYPSGIVEIPKSALPDIQAFRLGRWGLGDFMEANRRAAQWAIENAGVFTFTVHSSVQVSVDPEFKTFEMLCDMVKKSADRVELATPDQVADRVRQASRA